MTEQLTQKQSRVGKVPVTLVEGVTAKIDGQTVTVKGPKGQLTRTFRPEVEIVQEGKQLVVRPVDGSGQPGVQFQGLTRALLAGMAEGVKDGFPRSLDFRGVGYRAEMVGSELKMTVGLSHQPRVAIPETVTVKIETLDQGGTKFPRVHLASANKELIGQVAARIRSKRPPEPYTGKGVRYTGERVREKAGKAGKAK